MRRKKEVFSAKTGTGVSLVVSRNKLMGGLGPQPVMARLDITYGTTITVDLEGSRDGGVTWTQLATGTFTTGSPKYLHTTKTGIRYHKWRLNITANTECTVDKGYIGVGTRET